MAKLAQFDPTVASPSPVIGWFDPDEFAYKALPDASGLVTLTEAQWAARLSGLWAVSSGALVSYTPAAPPAPSLAQQAMAAMGEGVALTSTGTPSLDGTYAVDVNSQAHISSEMIALLASGGTVFADGTTSVVWPDVSDVNHTFNVAQFRAFALAVGAYVAALFKVQNGTLAAMPSPQLTIA